MAGAHLVVGGEDGSSKRKKRLLTCMHGAVGRSGKFKLKLE